MSKRKVLVIYNDKLRWGEVEKIRDDVAIVSVMIGCSIATEKYPVSQIVMLPKNKDSHDEFLNKSFAEFIKDFDFYSIFKEASDRVYEEIQRDKKKGE